MALIETIPETFFWGFMVFSIFLGILGIVLGFKKIAGAPFICVLAGILLFGLITVGTTSGITLQDRTDNATFTYNSNGQVSLASLGHSRDVYDLSNNELWIYMIFGSALFIVIGVLIQYAKW